MKKAFFIILAASILYGCKPEVDLERPTAFIDAPASGGIVNTADGLRLVATLTDNNGLLQYKLTVDGIDELNGIAADSTFSIVFVEGISNGDKAIYIDNTVELEPSTFNGRYRATLSCIDVEGNQATTDTVEFAIKNSIDSDPPQFTVTGPSEGDTLTIGQGFNTGGAVTDSQSLIYSEFFVGKADFSDTISFVTFPWIQNNTVDYSNNFSWWFPIDSSWAEGQYHVYYTAWDNYSGVSHSIPFYVSY